MCIRDSCTPDDFEEGFEKGIKSDNAILKELVSMWDAVDIDPKLDIFKMCIRDRFYIGSSVQDFAAHLRVRQNSVVTVSEQRPSACLVYTSRCG